MKFIIYDTETTGLLKPSPAKIELQPHMIEFHGCLLDEEFNLISELGTLLRVDFPLSELITRITGITDEMLKGQPHFSDMYDEFKEFFSQADLMIAHNLSFDENILNNELIRIGKEDDFIWPKHKLCTVERSISIRGHRLKMSDLHYIMTGKTFKDAHRAKNDVYALVRSFHGMVERGLVDLGEFE